LTCPDIGTYVPISVYPDIVPDISTFFHGTRYFPISGHTRYREIPISVHKIRPDIGSDIRIYGYWGIDIGTPDIGIGRPNILPRLDIMIVPDIMTFPQPALPFPAAVAAAAAAAYSML
jgi:hypothetical protein